MRFNYTRARIYVGNEFTTNNVITRCIATKKGTQYYLFGAFVFQIQRIGCQPGKVVYYTAANPTSCGLLNRESRTETERLAAHTAPPHAAGTKEKYKT